MDIEKTRRVSRPLSASTNTLQHMTADVAFGASEAAVEEVVVGQDGRLERHITRRDGSISVSHVEGDPGSKHNLGLHAAFDAAWLRGHATPQPSDARDAKMSSSHSGVSVADLFSGVGGLSVGMAEAARALNLNVEHALAVDTDEAALRVLESNFDVAEVRSDPIETLVDRVIGEPLSLNERRLRRRLSGLDVALGGPPCQGHSSLNNHTRRDDPKNSLYLAMARFVEVARPQHVLIENVPDVVHSRMNVVDATLAHLRSLGYHATSGVVRAADLGAAQSRRRHVLLATRSRIHLDIDDIVALHSQPARPVMWAIEDLTDHGLTAFDTSATHSAANRQRIQYLFDNGLYDLPNTQRPDCHRLKPHSYTSVYGRMRPDLPAPTITSGYGSTGQGRFVHPHAPRTLTPHEAARLQGFPDSFSFAAAPNRTAMARMIGNAVPSRLAYVPILEFLR